MKNMRKFFALVLSIIMVMSLATTAFAQTEPVVNGTGKATITISNAAKGETYSVYKLFDANVTENENGGSIFYTSTEEIPNELKPYFETKTELDGKKVDAYIVATDDAKSGDKLSDAAVAALKAWAATRTAVVSAVSDGSALTFDKLEYGYYIVTSTQGETAITVTSTNPEATIVDKNQTKPGITKDVNDKDVDIGQTVTYTLTSDTANYLTPEGKTNEDAEIVTQYVIYDTLPEYLSNVTVTSITIGGVAYPANGTVPQFDNNNQITIPWAEVDDEGNYASLYANGAEIEITYTATVTSSATIDGDGNKNEVTLTAYTTPDDTTPPDPWDEKWEDKEVIYTYAAALQKVDENKKPLAGAKFKAKGLNVTGSAGVYTVVSYDPTSEEYGTEMETDSEGQLVILGLSTDSVLTVKETVAPAGYNILVDTTTMTPFMTGEEIKAESKTIYYDANGNVTDTQTETSYTKTTYNVDLLKTAIVVVNKQGTELPETGGMGTTLFYVLGGLMVLGSAILLVTKKRMGAEG